MGRQVVEVQAVSQAPPEAVWRLLEDVTTWTEWAGFDEAEYAEEGNPPPHGRGALRRMRFGRLRSVERVLAFEPPTHFAYDYVGSLPLKDYRAEVSLAPVDGGTCITWHSEFTGKYPLTGAALRRALTRVLTDIATRLARAAEEGT
ncbi:MAG TPA: SRPBCC family protein [Acidimicrobiia bacterium]|nr:SRPBCC family protein [Acidimicrobiia bacterium]